MTNFRTIATWSFAFVFFALLSACGGGAVEDYQPPSVDFSVGQRCDFTENHHDGDTFDCITARDAFTVRLSAIDAPELSQAYGYAAQRALAALTPDGTQVSCYKTDVYGRQVCRVYSPDLADVQASLLAQGLAWYSRAYAYEQTQDEISRYTNLTLEARAARRGLWAQNDPQAPWDCRSTKVCR